MKASAKKPGSILGPSNLHHVKISAIKIYSERITTWTLLFECRSNGALFIAAYRPCKRPESCVSHLNPKARFVLLIVVAKILRGWRAEITKTIDETKCWPGGVSALGISLIKILRLDTHLPFPSALQPPSTLLSSTIYLFYFIQYLHVFPVTTPDHELRKGQIGKRGKQQTFLRPLSFQNLT